MKLKQIYLLMIGFVLLLQGCTENVVDTQEGSVVTLPSAQVITQPYQAPTIAPEISISAVAPYLTQTVTPDMSIAIPPCKNNGVPIKTPPDMRVHGAILYEGLDQDNQNTYFAIEGNPPLMGELQMFRYKIDGFLDRFSPDGEKLSFWGTENTVGYINTDGNRIEHVLDFSLFESILPANARIIGTKLDGWINDSLVYATIQFDVGKSTFNQISSILDIEEGQWKDELISSLKDFDRSPFVVYSPGVKFSPDLSRAVYANTNSLVIVYTESGQMIWEDTSLNLPGYHAQWAPDSQVFAYFEPEDPNLSIISRDGGIINTIQPPMHLSDPSIRSLSWSPDGHHIAWTIYDRGNDGGQQSIYVYDLITNSYVYQCPLHGDEDRGIPLIIWSPDSSEMATTFSALSPLLIHDIDSGEVVQLADKAVIIGWSDGFLINQTD